MSTGGWKENDPLDPDDYIFVRGIPIARVEIYLKQEELGAQLFDESMFQSERSRIACANVIRVLDKALMVFLVRHHLDRLPKQQIEIDIGDPSWGYIPISLTDPNSLFTILPTPDAPAGKVAWFRYKKYHPVSYTRSTNGAI